MFTKISFASSGFTSSNHHFIATELFSMEQGPHSSGNFNDFNNFKIWMVAIVDELHSGYLKLFVELLGNKKKNCEASTEETY